MILNKIKRILKYRFNLDQDKADELEIVEGIKRGVEFKGANLWTLIFAIFIASIGLNTNSTAVIIGAMLISPLMGPIMCIGLGAAILDINLIKKAFKNLAFAVIIGLVTSCLYFLISPLHEAKSELLARTNPTIWDILIALFGGLTGIIAGSRKNIGTAIPGVAIATALMPPLCTAGYALSTGNMSFLFGAFYLFLINCFFIFLATYWIIKLLKFKKVDSTSEPFSQLIIRIIYISSFVLTVPSLYFGYVLVKQEIFTKNVNTFIANEINGDSILVVTKEIDPTQKKVKIVLLGEELDENVIKEIERKKEKYNLEHSEIDITTTKSSSAAQEQHYSVIVDELFSLNKNNLKRKDSVINMLKNEQTRHEKLNVDETELLKEFTVLFGETNLFAVNKTILFNESYTPKDTIVIMYVSPKKKKTNLPTVKIEEWLKTRVGTKKAKVIIESDAKRMF
jgi:uncharacterized hydrophobic protein (TIGR00271 family)